MYYMKKKSCKIKLVHISDPSVYGNPLALGYIKTYTDSMLKGKVNTEIIEYLIKKVNNEIEEVAQEIVRKKPDIVAFSCYLWNVIQAINLTKEIKKRNKKIRVIFGGPDASIRGSKILKDSGGDALVLGEGEATFVDLVQKFLHGKTWANTPGAITIVKGKISKGPARKPIENLDTIPSPYLTGVFDGKIYDFWVYETSRGCPFNCTFCVWTNKGAIREFSMSRAKQEVDWLIKNAKDNVNINSPQIARYVSKVFFADQDITMQKARAVEILSYIRDNIGTKNLMWVVECNLKYFTKEVGEAGNFSKMNFCFGIQSINYELVKSLGRSPLTMVEMENKLELVKNWAPKARILLQIMLGIIGDTKKGFIATLNWCLEQCAKIQTMPVLAFHREFSPKLSATYNSMLRTGVQIFPLSVFPNTPLEKEAKQKGARWNKNPPYLMKGTNEFPEKDINYCYDLLKMFERFTFMMFENHIVQISVNDRVI